MTLNITVATRRSIYQCADYRLLDLITHKPSDFETQKIVVVTTFHWSALVCFAGVGRTHNLNVGEWLAERVRSIQVLRQIVDQRFVKGTAQIRAMSFFRAARSDEYFAVQLRERPEDPDVHSNYGAFLHDKKKDFDGAARSYRKALELNPTF